MKQRAPSRDSATRASDLPERKKSEILAFVWATLAVLLFLCLWSYHPDDVTFGASSPNAPIRNYAGITGAYISWGLNFVFGTASYFFVVLLGFWALSSWSGCRRQSVSLKLFSGTVFFISACSLFALLSAADTRLEFQKGGLIGFFLAHLLRDLFGNAALYVAGALFFLSILLATEFLVLPILFAAFKGIRSLFAGAFGALSKVNSEKIAAAIPLKKAPNPDDEIAKLKIPASPFNGMRGREPKPAQRRPEAVPAEDRLSPGPVKRVEPLIKTLIPAKPISQKDIIETPKPKLVKTAVGEYQLPSVDLLKDPVAGAQANRDEIDQSSRILEQTLTDFGIDARVVEVEQGPAITRYELQPASGVKIQKITALTDNIALAMKATSVRIIAPIPGKSRVGIEVPNRYTSLVTLKEILLSEKFQKSKSKLAVAIGKDTAGAPVIANLDAMPHLLIAGSTGSGKTVCVNALITSILYNASPEEVKFIMIDPKMVELACYNGLPHLLTPVVTEVDKVPTALAWLVSEMERRYKTLSKETVRNITAYNEKIQALPAPSDPNAPRAERMPYIVVLIDELADLMMAAGKEVESAIMRLAQLSRAVGIHLVLATQRPSVDVITGVIKANFPARISFQVASKVDSRTVLDMNGADALLGKGDLLFLDPALSKPVRAQGAFLADSEIEKTVEFITKQRKPEFDEEVLKAASKKSGSNHDFRGDEHFDEACRIIVSSGQASVSMLQRRLGLGYTRAARLVDMMEEDGIVGPYRGSKPREILIDLETLTQRQKAPQPSAPPAAAAE